MSDMKRQSISLNNYNLTTKQYNGKDYLVVPVVMMRDGVHSGSHGALRHTTEELSKFVDSWNGIPVTVTHPKVKGAFVSANSPEVLEQFSVGQVFETYIDEDKLKGYAYIEESRLSAINITALAAIKNNQPLDVSVGVFNDEIAQKGEWKGKAYVAIATNYRPDHLALLPGQSGACSWSDGCGIRANQKKEDMEEYKSKDPKKMLAVNTILFPEPKGLQLNELGYEELRHIVQKKLNSMDTALETFYLEELFKDYLVFKVCEGTQDDIFYRQNYQIKEDNTVELIAERQKVKKEINYININEKGETQMSEKKQPCCPEKVTKLINHEMTAYTESDREWLNAVESDRLDKMFPTDVQANEEPITDEKIKETISGYEAEQIIGLLPDSLKANVESGLEILTQKRNEKVQLILDNSKEGTWEKEELTAMSDSLLDKLVKTVPIKEEKTVVDYSGMGLGTKRTKPQVNAGTEDEILLPAGIKLEKEN